MAIGYRLVFGIWIAAIGCSSVANATTLKAHTEYLEDNAVDDAGPETRAFVPLDSLNSAYGNRPLSEVARAFKFTPDQNLFAQLELSPNEGITFQRGEPPRLKKPYWDPLINPKNMKLTIPFCTIKFAKDPVNHTHYLSHEELVQRMAALAPNKRDFTSNKVEQSQWQGSFSTTMYVNLPNQPQSSYLVELVQCMVDKVGNSTYRELTINELKTIFGRYLKVSVQLK